MKGILLLFVITYFVNAQKQELKENIGMEDINALKQRIQERKLHPLMRHTEDSKLHFPLDLSKLKKGSAEGERARIALPRVKILDLDFPKDAKQKYPENKAKLLKETFKGEPKLRPVEN